MTTEKGIEQRIIWEDWEQWSDKKQEQLMRFCFIELCQIMADIRTLLRENLMDMKATLREIEGHMV